MVRQSGKNLVPVQLLASANTPLAKKPLYAAFFIAVYIVSTEHVKI